MNTTKTDTVPVRTGEDTVRARQRVKAWMAELRFSLVEQTKMATAVSELARNAVVHGGGGSARLELMADGGRTGIRVTFEDQGPGTADIEKALKGGFSTGGGLGLGLSGARRLVNEFEIWSEPGKGTRVTITRWK